MILSVKMPGVWLVTNLDFHLKYGLLAIFQETLEGQKIDFPKILRNHYKTTFKAIFSVN